jgi:hypothetical protein
MLHQTCRAPQQPPVHKVAVHSGRCQLPGAEKDTQDQPTALLHNCYAHSNTPHTKAASTVCLPPSAALPFTTQTSACVIQTTAEQAPCALLPSLTAGPPRTHYRSARTHRKEKRTPYPRPHCPPPQHKGPSPLLPLTARCRARAARMCWRRPLCRGSAA